MPAIHPALTAHHLTLLILALFLLGLALLYLFPASSAYVSTSPSGVWLLREGQWARVQGHLESWTGKSSGLSLRLCADVGGCVTVYVPQQARGSLDETALPPIQALRAWGEVSSAQGGARFLRAHKIELLTESELEK
jgi:hypothetical protein